MGMWAKIFVIFLLAVIFGGCSGSTITEQPTDSFAALQLEIDQLTAPTGVESELWDELKRELAAVLKQHQAGHAATAAPNSSASMVNDLLMSGLTAGEITLTWSYQNQGDYDLNGEVNISDISPIGMYFQATSASTNWAMASIADGDGNQEVNLADIAPIGMNFAAAVSGYYLQSTTTPASEPSWQQVGEIAFSAGVANDGDGRPQFTISIAEPAQGTSFRVVPFHDNGTDIDSGIGSNQRTYGSSPQVEALVEQAHQALLNGDGDTASPLFDQVLDLAPDNPSANFGLAFLELMREGNDVVSFLNEQNEPLYKNITLLPVTSMLEPVTRGRLWNSLARISADRETSGVQIDELSYAEIRAEVIVLIDVLTEITDLLDLALGSMPDDWSMTILEDWNDPQAGLIEITKPDVLTLSATLELAVGLLHLSIAYSCEPMGIAAMGPEDDDLEITGQIGEETEFADVNSDGFIDMHEIADALPLTDTFGKLNDDGQMRLSTCTTYVHRALDKAVTATELYLATGSLADHWAFYMEQSEFDDLATQWDSYGRPYADQLVAMWAGPTTLTISDGLLEYYPDLADDPGEAFSISVNCAEFIANFPEDLRDFPLRFSYTEEFGETSLQLPELVTDAFSDSTVLGLFPAGLTQEQYEVLFSSMM